MSRRLVRCECPNFLSSPILLWLSAFGIGSYLGHSGLERVDDGDVAVDGERHEGEDGHGHREERDEVVHRAVPSSEWPVPVGVMKLFSICVMQCYLYCGRRRKVHALFPDPQITAVFACSRTKLFPQNH